MWSARTIRLTLIAWLGAALVAVPAMAAAPTAADRAAGYLERVQNRDGGLGTAPGAGSAPQETMWAALGLTAAGRDPADVRRRGGRTLLDAVRREAGRARTTGDLTRAILAIAGTGRAPEPALVTTLLGQRRADGSFGGQVPWTAFAVLALRAGGHPPSDEAVAGAVAYLAAQQNDDGGFSFAQRGARSGVDETAAALQALVAGGRAPADPAVTRAADWLVATQRADGGFPLVPGAPANAQSTAWAVQALLAAGRSPAAVRSDRGRTPLRYLRARQRRDGSIRYSRTSAQTPVWVTAQALLALARAPFPLGRPAP